MERKRKKWKREEDSLPQLFRREDGDLKLEKILLKTSDVKKMPT